MQVFAWRMTKNHFLLSMTVSLMVFVYALLSFACICLFSVVTHFLSFTLDRSGMQKRVDDFKKEVSKDCFEVTFLSVSTVFEENIQEH